MDRIAKIFRNSIALVGVVGALSLPHAFKVFDGQPKLIFHGDGQSWQLKGHLIKEQLGLAGIDHAKLTVVTHDGGYNSFPVGADGKMGGWAGPGWIKNVRKDNPATMDLIMIINLDDGYGEVAGGSAQVDSIVKRMLVAYDYFKSAGAKEVLFANKHYRWGRYRNGKPTSKPNTGAVEILKEYTKRTGRPCGDIWTLSKGFFPYHIGNDYEHGADLIKAMYGQVYAKMLLEYDGMQTTQAKTAWDARDTYLMTKEKAMRDRATVEFTANPGNSIADIGTTINGVITLHRDKIDGDWKTKTFSAYVVLMAHLYGHTLAVYAVSDTFSLASDVSPFKITIPDSASVLAYAPAGRNYFPLVCDSFRVAVFTGIPKAGHDASFGYLSHQLSAPYLFKRTATALMSGTGYRESRAVSLLVPNTGFATWPFAIDLQGRKLGRTQAPAAMWWYSSRSKSLEIQ